MNKFFYLTLTALLLSSFVYADISNSNILSPDSNNLNQDLQNQAVLTSQIQSLSSKIDKLPSTEEINSSFAQFDSSLKGLFQQNTGLFVLILVINDGLIFAAYFIAKGNGMV